MLRWYADNSELRGIWDAPIPDILIFGGFAIEDSAAAELHAVIQRIKSGYRSEADFPIKWNFRDLNSYFQEHQLSDLFDILLADSLRWRTEIFQLASDVDFKIITSVIKCHSRARGVLLDTREIVTRFAFSNALMRVGLFAKDISPRRVELVLDWPSEGQRNLFNDEYRTAYYEGSTADYPREYFCRALKPLGFADSLLFSCTIESSLLQFSDLIAGAIRELVDVALGKRNDDALGLSLIRLVRDKFRGAPSQIIGRGISIAPTRSEFYKTVSRGITSLLF